MREVVNGLMYILSTGCQWRAIPKDLPPRSSVYDYFDLWTYDGTLERIHHALYERCREQAQRETSPTAARQPTCWCRRCCRETCATVWRGRAMGASPARLTRAARSVARKGWLDPGTRESGAA